MRPRGIAALVSIAALAAAIGFHIAGMASSSESWGNIAFATLVLAAFLPRRLRTKRRPSLRDE